MAEDQNPARPQGRQCEHPIEHKSRVAHTDVDDLGTTDRRCECRRACRFAFVLGIDVPVLSAFPQA
jgi:hypothetical protein